jgi:hypothetical protein
MRERIQFGRRPCICVHKRNRRILSVRLHLNASAEQLRSKLLPGFSPRRLRTNSSWLLERQVQSTARETCQVKYGPLPLLYFKHKTFSSAFVAAGVKDTGRLLQYIERYV